MPASGETAFGPSTTYPNLSFDKVRQCNSPASPAHACLRTGSLAQTRSPQDTLQPGRVALIERPDRVAVQVEYAPAPPVRGQARHYYLRSIPWIAGHVVCPE